MHLWMLVVWQVLSYLWILIHGGLGAVAWLLEHRLRRREADLRQIEDADVRSRWGTVSQLQGYTSLPCAGHTGDGLSPAEINCLPCATVGECSGIHEDECSICLHALRMGDNVRQLAGCGHTFHKPCIDLWLLRRADCPLCKRPVKTAGATES